MEKFQFDKKVLVIIPTYNEEENIKDIVSLVLEMYADLNLKILIVDDNSKDNTASIVKEMMKNSKRIDILERAGKLGLGTAYIEAFKYALERDYDFVVQMDADFSHDPIYLKSMLEATKDNDIIIGSRYITGVNVVNWPMSRLLLSYGGSLYVRIFAGLPVMDATGGYKVISKKVLEGISLDNIGASGYSFQIEVNFRAWKNKFKIKEVPIIFKDREKGTTKMTTGIITEALYLIWKLRVLSLFNKI